MRQGGHPVIGLQQASVSTLGDSNVDSCQASIAQQGV